MHIKNKILPEIINLKKELFFDFVNNSPTDFKIRDKKYIISGYIVLYSYNTL